ncbi:FtsB family cell division protein [Thermomonospora catenispora]|uniref:FtsB family cell division protein n=1 Tax=Thermomonospora catenispora TaxID=2493090 RepID=UPI00112386AC|nr:septum formation initiator family protein [Thermomonospora catenispora]TNY37197.1 septum formation initiator family protein [Thermomonospora catenispora]
MPSARDPRAAGDVVRDDDRRPRGHLTGRAAILALVVCAIALTLAYPVREYIAQRREIAELRHRERLAYREVQRLAEHKRRLSDEAYIKREARRRLHYCMPGEKCYVVLDDDADDAPRQTGPARKPPWYETLWRSVQAADRP